MKQDCSTTLFPNTPQKIKTLKSKLLAKSAVHEMDMKTYKKQ
jgi:hypothetical protein